MRTRATSRTFWFWSGLVITVAILVLLAVLAFLVGDANRTTTPRGQVPGVTDDAPATRAATLGMIQADGIDLAVVRVGHVVLSGRNIPEESFSSVWTSPSGDQVLEVYESGLTVLTEVPQIGPNATEYYAAVVAEAGRPSVFITTVNGVQALAVEPNTDKLGTNPGLVRFEYEGFSVVVSGRGLSVTYLTDVASRLQPVVASGVSSG
jgi:hypothetical protein